MRGLLSGKAFDCSECAIAGFRYTPLFIARGEPLQLHELAFEEGVEFFSLHVDLIGSVLDEQQRGEFVRTLHRFSPCHSIADSRDGDWLRMAGPLRGGPQIIGREVWVTTVLT